MVRRILFWSMVAGTVLLDQALKLLIVYLHPATGLFRLVQNTGAGFGILKGYTVLLTIISLVVAMAIILNVRKIPLEWWTQACWGLFLGGVIGNLIDRAVRGSVIDFIDFRIWPAFNVADAAITVAAVGLIIYYWKK
ncbi:signal peptidase II [Candidatus Woesearchaeota archaeon]|nr:signal peptidase II [Candidatus Woesearchaeota archaeon]